MRVRTADDEHASDEEPDPFEEARIEELEAIPHAPAKKRKSSSTYNSRTLGECRKRGWIAQGVEQTIKIPGGRTFKRDLFGVIDVVAIVPPGEEIECSKRDAAGNICSSAEHGSDDCCLQFDMEGEHRVRRIPGGTIGIQTTSGGTGGAHSPHRAKILSEPRARAWVEAGNRLELWSWAKQGARGKAKRWTLRVEVFTSESWSPRDAAEG